MNVNRTLVWYFEYFLASFYDKDLLGIYSYREAVDWRCSVKNVFLKILQNSQENTCVEVSFLIKLQAWLVTLLKKRFPVNFAKFLRTLFLRKFKLHRTSPVAASVNKIFHLCQVTSMIVSITRAVFLEIDDFFSSECMRHTYSNVYQNLNAIIDVLRICKYGIRFLGHSTLWNIKYQHKVIFYIYFLRKEIRHNENLVWNWWASYFNVSKILPFFSFVFSFSDMDENLESNTDIFKHYGEYY